MRGTSRDVYQGSIDPFRTEQLRYADRLGSIWGCSSDAAVSGASSQGNYCQGVRSKLRGPVGDRNQSAVPLTKAAVSPIAPGRYRTLCNQYVPTFMLLACVFHGGDDLLPGTRHHRGQEFQAHMFAGEDFINEQILNGRAYRVED